MTYVSFDHGPLFTERFLIQTKNVTKSVVENPQVLLDSNFFATVAWPSDLPFLRVNLDIYYILSYGFISSKYPREPAIAGCLAMSVCSCYVRFRVSVRKSQSR